MNAYPMNLIIFQHEETAASKPNFEIAVIIGSNGIFLLFQRSLICYYRPVVVKYSVKRKNPHWGRNLPVSVGKFISFQGNWSCLK